MPWKMVIILLFGILLEQMVIRLQENFLFTVDVPVSETPAENENEANSQNVNQDETPLGNVGDTKTNEQSQLPSYLIPVIVIVLIAIIVGIFVGLRRKKLINIYSNC